MAAELKVKSGGSWRTITAPEVKVSGTWRAIQTIEVKSGGIWREVFSTGLQVSLSNTSVSNVRVSTSPCFAGVRYHSNGNEHASSNSGTWSVSRGLWLDSGLNSEVWLERTINSGTLTTDGIGSGRVVMSTTRIIDVQRSVTGIKTCNVTVRAYDAASGGNLLSTATFDLTAEFESGA